MLKSILVIATAALITVSFGFADQNQKVVIPVDQTAANDGKQMYVNYCAPCHGTDGKGNGPAASAFKNHPTDLTSLKKNNNGKFPDNHVVAILHFGVEEPAHGSANMPVWGPILRNMNPSNAQEKQLRISNLTRYLESIQAQ
jgi:mono/diheme cytochrome c family protein